MTPTTTHATNSDPTAIRPGDYIPDPLHSHILFAVTHFGLSTYIGEFTGKAGTLHFDPARFADARLKITLSVASVRTSSSVLDEELRGARWPSFSLHGITHEVLLVARFHRSGINPVKQAYTVGFDVRGSIRRSDFGGAPACP